MALNQKPESSELMIHLPSEPERSGSCLSYLPVESAAHVWIFVPEIPVFH